MKIEKHPGKKLTLTKSTLRNLTVRTGIKAGANGCGCGGKSLIQHESRMV